MIEETWQEALIEVFRKVSRRIRAYRIGKRVRKTLLRLERWEKACATEDASMRMAGLVNVRSAIQYCRVKSKRRKG